ncbi:hypothetical protein EI293_00940 [Hymenobacter perfusus]|uniref:Uncharacterized protein n=1 Tax=Hymenobacter perfusus TaxID=1236770 RepID=A0A3R9P073_9BACT|nr:hypothetical protein EI293_00940 [Hymenobacter perfusus]
MARSYRHTPIMAVTTAASEKQDKRQANRLLRRKVRQGKVCLTLREVSNVWAFSKDGKTYQLSATARNIRK